LGFGFLFYCGLMSGGVIRSDTSAFLIFRAFSPNVCIYLLLFFFFFLCGFLSIALIPSGMENPGLFCVFLGAGGLDNPRMPFAVLVLYHTGLGVF
jgi:hypothetical protein